MKLVGRWVMCVLAVTLLGGAVHVSAAEDAEMASSPNGQRAQRLFNEQLEALKKDYFKRADEPVQRFEQASERHVARYVGLLERQVIALTRAGNFDAAQAVQAALEQSKQWVLTPPDKDGLHFLSKVSLDVPADAQSSKYGVDLLVNIEKTGELYTKQVEQLFKRYEADVIAARMAFEKTLQDISDIEQREGRLSAVKQVRAAIEVVKNLPAVQMPEAPVDNAQPDGPDKRAVAEKIDLPEGTAGTYNVFYRDINNSSRLRAMLLMTSEGCYCLGRYTLAEGEEQARWDVKQLPITLLERNENTLVLSYTLPDGTDIIHEFAAGQRSQSDARYWRGKENYPLRGNAMSCNIYKSGSAMPRSLGIEDGVYEMKMKILTDTEGNPMQKDVRLKILVIDGVMVKTHHNFTDSPDRWQDSEPIAYYAYERDGQINITPDRGLAFIRHLAYMDMEAVNGERKIRYWWDDNWQREGQGPSMTGVFKKLVEEAD